MQEQVQNAVRGSPEAVRTQGRSIGGKTGKGGRGNSPTDRRELSTIASIRACVKTRVIAIALAQQEHGRQVDLGTGEEDCRAGCSYPSHGDGHGGNEGDDPTAARPGTKAGRRKREDGGRATDKAKEH
ncbi:unnamed protein product, partial [Ixodes pacificus]